MSDRERWIVYPIVFLALVLGLNNYIRNGTNVAFGVLECNSLVVRSPDGKEKIRVSGIGQSGQLAVYGADNSPILSISAADSGNSGRLVIKGEKGSNIILTASQSGSNAKITTDNLKPQIVLGYSAIDQQFGLAGYENNKPCVSVTNDFGTVFYTRDGIRRAIEQMDAGDEPTNHEDQADEGASQSSDNDSASDSSGSVAGEANSDEAAPGDTIAPKLDNDPSTSNADEATNPLAPEE